MIALFASIVVQSAATGSAVHGELHVPSVTTGPVATVVYLKNLSIPRLGKESDEAIIKDLVAAGQLVLALDYQHHAKARSPELNADLLELREAVAGKNRTLLVDFPIDPNRLFIIPEGWRLKRDVEFARDGERVLAMDIIYPSNPKTKVPLLMEITCDNLNRMGSGSLLFCHDTLFEGAPLAGFAAAMVDHPVPPPYKGIDDPMPASLDRMKAATRRLRELNDECNLNGTIGVMGFSRGATFAAMLAASGKAHVQAALIHGNRFDYLDLLPDDPMLARFEKAWGPRQANPQRWAEHGAVYYLTPEAAPMLLNTSDTESCEYRYGLEKLGKRLTQLGIEHEFTVDRDGRGHRVSTDPRTLARFYEFFGKHLRR